MKVAKVHVDDNQYVEQGQLLFSIDGLPFRIELEASKAELGLVRQEVDSLRAGFLENESEIKNAAERVRYLKAEHERLRKLVASSLTAAISASATLVASTATCVMLEGTIRTIRVSVRMKMITIVIVRAVVVVHLLLAPFCCFWIRLGTFRA